MHNMRPPWRVTTPKCHSKKKELLDYGREFHNENSNLTRRIPKDIVMTEKLALIVQQADIKHILVVKWLH